MTVCHHMIANCRPPVSAISSLISSCERALSSVMVTPRLSWSISNTACTRSSSASLSPDG